MHGIHHDPGRPGRRLGGAGGARGAERTVDAGDLRLMLVEIAAVPDRAEVLARARRRVARTGSHLTAEEIISARDADRR